MNKKILLPLIAAVLCLFLAGCSSVGLSVDTLMHPPKAVGDKADIQSLIDKTAGEGYTLKYPQSGNFRSAITMQDIDSDNVDEAVAFYLPQGDIATVNMMVMDIIDGTWQVVGNFKSQSSAVESLNFCDIDGDGFSEIIPSYKTYTPNINQLAVFTYDGISLKEISSDYTCSSLVTGDFADGGKDELMLLSLFSTEKEAMATLLTLNETKSELSELGSSPLDPDVASFAQLLTGEVFEGQRGLVIDGCTTSGEYNTQIVYYNKYFKSLERIAFTENISYNQAKRAYAVMSKDVNDDSVIEVPSVFKLKIEEDRADVAPCAEIYWCQQTEEGTVHLISHEAVSFSYKFSFDIPAEWDGKFTAHTNHDENEVTFYTWNKVKIGDELLKIRITDKNTQEIPEGYKSLAENESRVYSYKIPETSDKMILGDDEIIGAFELMQ